MGTALRALIVEDSATDYELLVAELRRGGYDPIASRVETAGEMDAALDAAAWDILLSDHSLPTFSAAEALILLQQHGLDLPAIVVSGTLGEEKAVALLKMGAHDFVLKERLARLVPAIQRELREAEGRRSRRAAEQALRAREELFRSVVENALDMVLLVGSTGAIQYASPSTAHLLGYGLDEIVGADGFAFVHPDDSPDLRAHFQRFRSSGGEPHLREFRVRHKGGGWLTIEAIASPIRGWGERYVITARDTTARRQAEEEVRDGLHRLRLTLESTVRALGSAAEVRDPYTAGHQRRVAQLAHAIGCRLGLPQVQLDGLRTMALLHDIGKLRVPADVLSKPGRLTDIEHKLMQTHVEAGYEILCQIPFEWPVAEVVRQHHERVDGSGYPAGLVGEAMLQEAKILAVADVVEAMASHRPYRPALGMDAATEEITRGRGILYSSAVADACVAVLRDGFEFEVPELLPPIRPRDAPDRAPA
jgi:PAS domain S-box-containing protein/putative nucleotidyltransferase with HDIG domain